MVEVTSYVVSYTTCDNFFEPDKLTILKTIGGRFINIWYTLIAQPDGRTTVELDPQKLKMPI